MNNKNLFALLLVFLIILQFKFVYSPGKNRLKSLNSLIENKEKEFETLKKLCAEYSEREDRNIEDAVKTARADFSLFSYAGGLLAGHKLEKSVAGIQPLPVSIKDGFSVERLKLSLQRVTLKQLYDFLYEIEGSQNAVYITDFRMRKDKDNPFFLSAEMELAAVKTANQDPSS